MMSLKILLRSGGVVEISLSRFIAKSSKNSLKTLRTLSQKLKLVMPPLFRPVKLRV